MERSQETLQLLRELRDLQQAHLAEYRRVTQRSLEIQEQSLARQEQVSRLYRRALGAGAIVVGVLLLLVLYVLSFLS